VRKPVVSGLFYDSDPETLEKRIDWCYQHPLGPGSRPHKMGEKRNIRGIIVPHAGYQYSGPVAAHAYLELARDGFPDTFVVIGPNHTGLGSGVSIMNSGKWETPLGLVEIDRELAQEIQKQGPIIDEEPIGHQGEHSLEVQLPFLQDINPNFRIVPISMLMQDLETSTEVGMAISKASKILGRNIVVIASTDLTHYKPHEQAQEADQKVINALEHMDEKELQKVVFENHITMCGYGPVTATIVATREMGATKARILKYATSGDTSGDYSSVVGYLSSILL
jgi:AmmeMemoRadiSam system protein B